MTSILALSGRKQYERVFEEIYTLSRCSFMLSYDFLNSFIYCAVEWEAKH